MTEMVFVHGVSTRRVEGDPTYEAGVIDRDRRFATVAFKSGAAHIVNPYWGNYGAEPQWKLQCVPGMASKHQALGAGGEDMGEQPDLAASDRLLNAARRDFPAVVGALSAAAIETADAADLADAERLWAGAAAYAAASPKPSWLKKLDSDEEFLGRLSEEAAAQTGRRDLGVADDVLAAGAKVLVKVSNLLNSPVAGVARQDVTPRVAIFIGDVFRYLKDGPARAAIRAEISTAIAGAAGRAAAGRTKLILTGHSMGGVILYDLLSDPAAVATIEQALGGPLTVDLLLTVGSQVALFEELKVFSASSPAYSLAAGKVPRPACAKAWWNVFNKIDVLSFLVAPVFDGASDLQIDTMAGVTDAHGGYFTNMMFYTRLNKRFDQEGLLT